MVKEVNQNIFVNDWDYPDKGDHHCDDPEKKKLIEKLAKMITDSLDRKIPGGLKENHFDFWMRDCSPTEGMTSKSSRRTITASDKAGPARCMGRSAGVLSDSGIFIAPGKISASVWYTYYV